MIVGDSAESIVASIEREIRCGGLTPGQKLPTVRELADSLRVNKNTVAAAYRTLQTSGLTISERRRGTLVAPASIFARGVVIPIAPGVHNLADGNPDPTLLPELTHYARRLEHRPPHLYGEAKNDSGLIAFIKSDFESDGIPADHVSVTAGALDAIERLLSTVVRPGDRIGVEDPGYPAVLNLVRALGCIAVPIMIDQFGPVPESIANGFKSRIRALIFSSRGQNATGAAFDDERSRHLGALFAEAEPELLIIDDDHLSRLSFLPARTVNIRSGGRWATVRSVSKFLGPDMRLAFVAGDEVTISRLEARQSVGARWQSNLLQRIALSALSDKNLAENLREATRLYDQRRMYLLDELQRRNISAASRSGLNVWISVREESATTQWLMSAGFAVRPGEEFRISSGTGLRVTTARLERDEAREFADALGNFLSGRNSTYVT